MLNATSEPADVSRRHLWTAVNVVVLPPFGIGAVLILVFTYWIGSPAAFNLYSSLSMLPWVMVLGASLGLVLGGCSGLYLPFLLFALPYVMVTARLWRSG